MTRLQAIRLIRSGGLLEKNRYSDWDGGEKDLQIWIRKEDHCNFQNRRKHEHVTIGPLHLRFWAVSHPHWIHITPKQLLGFIRRNYPRK